MYFTHILKEVNFWLAQLCVILAGVRVAAFGAYRYTAARLCSILADIRVAAFGAYRCTAARLCSILAAYV